MPVEHYDFKPTPDQRSFADQIGHSVHANANYFKTLGLPIKPPPVPDEETPQALRSHLGASYDYVAQVLAAMTEEDFNRRDVNFSRVGPPTPHTAQDVFMRAYMHSAHHRGSVVVYLRLAGIEPPGMALLGSGLSVAGTPTPRPRTAVTGTIRRACVTALGGKPAWKGGPRGAPHPCTLRQPTKA